MRNQKLGNPSRQHLLAKLHEIYWSIRNARRWQLSRKRQLYRKAQKLKQLLLDDGLDPEALRLYCRSRASLDRAAIARFEDYLQKNDIDFENTRKS